MARRSRKAEDQGIAILIAIGGAVWVLSQVWVYLLIGGAIAVAGAVVWYVVQQHRARSSHEQPDIIRQAEQPANPYRELVAVNPTVFDDPTAAEVAALDVFSAWARTLPRAPRRPARHVTAVSLRSRLIGRLESQCIGRHAVWRHTPYGGRKAVSGPPVTPESVDPWTADPDELRTQSRHYASCQRCKAEGKIRCELCSATGRIACQPCRGLGKIRGETASGQVRQLNCKACRGRGDIACSACHRGQLKCPDCHGKKKLDRWLEISEETRTDVQVEPDGPILKAFAWGKDGVEAPDSAIAQDAKVLVQQVCETTFERAALESRLPPGWLDAYWRDIAPEIRPGERIARQRFSLLEVPAVEVTYSLDGAEAQVVELEGLRLLAPPPDADRLFHRRARRLNWAAIALAAVPAFVGISYLARGSYYRSQDVGFAFLALTATALATYLFFAASSLRQRLARLWGGLGAAAVIAATFFAIQAEPSVSDARAYVEAGDVEAARTELNALGDPSDPELEPIWSRLYLAEVLDAPSVDVAESIAAKLPDNAKERAEATAHIDRLLSGDARAFVKTGRFGDALTRIARASKAFRATKDARQIELAAVRGLWRRCHSSADWECAFAKADALGTLDAESGQSARAQTLAALETRATTAQAEVARQKDLDQRIELAETTLALWALWASRSGESEPPSLAGLRERLGSDKKQQERIAAREAKAAERQRKAEERARAREARRRERQERREQRLSAPLQCCDGSLSPSCTCGGSRRGCCSHHGGVCGCSN